eukprot:1238534-Rhodomonas_salina.2
MGRCCLFLGSRRCRLAKLNASAARVEDSDGNLAMELAVSDSPSEIHALRRTYTSNRDSPHEQCSVLLVLLLLLLLILLLLLCMIITAVSLNACFLTHVLGWRIPDGATRDKVTCGCLHARCAMRGTDGWRVDGRGSMLHKACSSNVVLKNPQVASIQLDYAMLGTHTELLSH